MTRMLRPAIRWVALVTLVLVVTSLTPTPAASQEPAREPSGPAPSAGCGTSTSGPVVEQEHHVDVGGADRWFLYTVPSAHDGSTPLPLVVSFHGLGEGARIHTLMTEYSGIAEREGFVVAFPQGRFDPVRWDVSPTAEPNEDLQFVEAILDALGDELCLDERRVYASGLSFGAFMTSLVACKLSHRFAAVAPVAGIILPAPCDQARAVPIVTFHGTDDQIVRFNGGFGPIPLQAGAAGRAATDVDLDGPGTPAYVRGWAERNGCDPSPTDTQTSDEILHRVFDCPPGADVEFYIVLGGGHAWPGSEFSRSIGAIVGHTTFEIHASEVAWAFFQRHRLPCPDDQDCTSGTSDTPDLPGISDAPDTPSAPEEPTTPAAAVPAPSSMLQAVAPAFTG